MDYCLKWKKCYLFTIIISDRMYGSGRMMCHGIVPDDVHAVQCNSDA